MSRRTYQPIDRYDPAAEFYRQQDEERREREHVERASRWIASKLSGHQFDTLEALKRSVVDLVTTLQGGEPDDEMMGTITKAVTLLWLGHCEFDSMYRRCVVKESSGIKFLPAA